MKAKQKANELVDRYLEYVEAYSSDSQLQNAKTCALIAVEFAREQFNKYCSAEMGTDGTYDDHFDTLIAVEELIEITYAASRSEYEYWLDVKREIKAIR